MKRLLSTVGRFILWFMFWFFVKYWYLAALSVLLIILGVFFKPLMWAGLILAGLTAILAIIRTFIKLAELGLFAATVAGAGAVSSKMNSYNDRVNEDDPNRIRSI